MSFLRCHVCAARLTWVKGVALDDSDFKPEVCPGTNEMPHFPVTEWEPQDYTCAHCARDMRKNPHETCSNGGVCMSIEEFRHPVAVREMMKSLQSRNNGL